MDNKCVIFHLLVVCCCFFSNINSANLCQEKRRWIESEISLPKATTKKYKNKIDCVFETDFAMKIHPNVLQLTFYGSFDVKGEMPSCSADYLEIFVSCSYISIGRFCGASGPASVISPDRCLRIVFHSDYALSGTGFRAILMVTSRPDTLSPLINHRIDSTPGSGIFSSPGYPHRYPARLSEQTIVFEATQKAYRHFDVTEVAPLVHTKTIILYSLGEQQLHSSGTGIRVYFMEFKTSTGEKRHNEELGTCSIVTDDILSVEVFEFSGVRGRKKETHTFCGELNPFVLTWTKYTTVRITFRTNNDSSVSRGFIAGYIVYRAALPSKADCNGSNMNLKRMESLVALLLVIPVSILL